MDNKNENDSFTYAYSAAQQQEVKKIREKYISRESDKMERLRALDESVTKKGTVASLILGIFSALVLGVGMCCCLVWTDSLFIPGIIIGVIGIIGVSLSYPMYSAITKKERRRIAPEILKLTDELLK